uniref:Cofactor of BRCA1 n=1 Tax=Heterorhabditis bacteriophora TaxID=37862 RepID=A0A1I7XKA7_HETBA
MNAAKELESYGIPGPSKIRQILSKTRKVSTLINAVSKFREDNNIKIETLAPALQLLDLLNVKRVEFHEQALIDITERITSRIRVLGENSSADSVRKLEQQLDKCFRMFRLPYFRPIVLETLKQLPKVPDRYLKVIICDVALYNECAVTVRQQIWLKNENLFLEAIRPIIEILISMVGDHEELFLALLKFIRDTFALTNEVQLCSLRLELIMAAHDANIESLVKSDPCHDFAWCLDACMRDKHLEGQQTGRLKNILDGCKKSNIEMICDLAMIAADVHVVHFLSAMTVKKLRDTTGAYLPRDMPSVHLLIRILSLGSYAQEIVTSHTVPPEIVDSIFFTKFLPLFVSMMVEDTIRFELIRSSGVDISEEFAVSSYLNSPPDTIITFLKASSVAALLWLHYCLDMLPNKRRTGDLRGLARYVSVLPIMKDKLASRGVWCHLFFHCLIFSNQFESVLSDPQMQHTIIEEIIMENIMLDSYVKYQLLRLINQVGMIWGVAKSVEMLERVEPGVFVNPVLEDLAQYRTEYTKLVDKLNPKPIEEQPSTVITGQQDSPNKLSITGMGSPPGAVRQYPIIPGSVTPRTGF